ncbi:hypothetical protein EDF33_102238 [Curtobacterium sp. PhB146]|nr:hypothetical protein EDF33_102238 [Curtobacterium sp. PhB146]
MVGLGMSPTDYRNLTLLERSEILAAVQRHNAKK